jgi:hypothetical protein
MNPRTPLFKVNVGLDVLGTSYQHEAWMWSAVVAWRKSFAEHYCDFVFCGVVLVVNDAIYP